MAVDWFDPRELIARLGARSPVLVPSPRDVPTPPPTDIAAALGMVRNRFGRDVLCAVNSATPNADERAGLHEMIGAEQHREADYRETMLSTAQAALRKAEDLWATRRTHTREDHARMDQMRARCLHQKALQFPSREIAHWHVLRTAVLTEMSYTKLCPGCEGRGHSPGSTKDDAFIPNLRLCSDCGGTGRKAVSDRARAELLKRDESSFRKTWSNLYSWTFNLLAQHEAEAVRQFWYALTYRERTPLPDTSNVTVEFTGEWGGINLFGRTRSGEHNEQP